MFDPDTITFDPNKWAEALKTAHETIEQGGESANVARATVFLLYSHLIYQLSLVELLPTDFFDRPQLAAVLSAVHQSKKEQA